MSDARDVTALGAARQAELLAAGEVTSRELTAATLSAIRGQQLQVNAAVAMFDEEALAAADAADRRRAAGHAGPLTGVPIAVKDDLDLAGLVTGRGSRSMTRPAAVDADLVAGLRAAGLVIVAKTTLPELAIYGFTETEAHGITRNPHHTGHSPGGSSGGSAALVGAGVVGIATASDGAGSIRIPAASCGLVGFKPTQGTMPSSGGWYGLSTQGCVTPTLADTGIFLDEFGRFPESLSQAARNAPPPLRVGWSLSGSSATRPAALDPQARAALDRAVTALASAGHHVRQVQIPYGLDAKSLTVRYLRGIHDSAVAVDDLEMLEDRTRTIARLGAPFTPKVVDWAIRRGRAFGASVHDQLGVDVLLTPVMSGPALPIGRWEGLGGLRLVLAMNSHYPYTAQWNHAGAPAVSMPAGATVDGLPLAVQLIARPGDDARLMSVAGQVEGGLS
ncbi:amidase family protein [Aeromicrobium sp. CF3.5]|uniref:amidase family protein n=1 Tax=Aeromicrobium sp. CF3.5 TaxID=3373078 RepID=UPI003EE802C0